MFIDHDLEGKEVLPDSFKGFKKKNAVSPGIVFFTDGKENNSGT